MNTWLAESVSNWLPISTISVVPGQGFADVVNSSYVSWIRDIGLSHHGQVNLVHRLMTSIPIKSCSIVWFLMSRISGYRWFLSSYSCLLSTHIKGWYLTCSFTVLLCPLQYLPAILSVMPLMSYFWLLSSRYSVLPLFISSSSFYVSTLFFGL